MAGGKATVRWKGGVASLKDLKEIGDERLLHHAPLLFDLIYFYQKHRNNPQRINVTELEGEPVITLKARSVYDLTSVQSRDAAEGVKRELIKLTKVDFHMIYETDSSLKKVWFTRFQKSQKTPSALFFKELISIQRMVR